MNPRESLIVRSLPEEVQRTGATVVEMSTDRGYRLKVRISVPCAVFAGHPSVHEGISTSTYFDKCAKLVDAILLRASAFLFSLLGTCLMVNLSKPWISDLVLSRLCAPIRVAMRNPTMRASYSASLFVAVNSKRSA
nr:hypothetical protein [Tanacetum cinerariifolium]